MGLLLVSSQTMDRQQLSFPKPQASPVDVPGGSEFDQAREDTDPVLPGTEDTPDADEIVTGVLPPADGVETPPAFDTSSLDVPQPSVDGPSGLGDAPAIADEVTVPETGSGDRVGSAGNVAGVPASPSLEAPEAPIAAPATDTSAPEAVDAPGTEALEVTEAPAAEPAPEAATEIAALPAETGDAPPLAVDSAPAVQSDSDAPASPVAPQIGDGPTLEGVRVPETEAAPEPGHVNVDAQPVQPGQAIDHPGGGAGHLDRTDHVGAVLAYVYDAALRFHGSVGGIRHEIVGLQHCIRPLEGGVDIAVVQDHLSRGVQRRLHLAPQSGSGFLGMGPPVPLDVERPAPLDGRPGGVGNHGHAAGEDGEGLTGFGARDWYHVEYAGHGPGRPVVDAGNRAVVPGAAFDGSVDLAGQCRVAAGDLPQAEFELLTPE